MYRGVLFYLYIIILVLTLCLHIKLFNIPLQTILIFFSLIFGILIYFRSIKTIVFDVKYKPLLSYSIFVISFVVILILHDILDNKSVGTIKGLSNFIYLSYSLILVYIFNDETYIYRVKKIFIYILIIYIFVYIFSFTEGGENEVLIFKTRTNLAWFLLFLYVVTYDQFSQFYKSVLGVIILVLLLMNSSRSPIIAFFLINFILYRDIIFTKLFIKYMLFIIALLLLIMYFFSDKFILAYERMSNITNLSYASSTGYRLSVITDGFKSALHNFFGNGYASFTDIFMKISSINLTSTHGNFSADNSYIELLFDVGWIPLIILLFFFYYMYKSNLNNKILMIYLALLMIFDSIMYNNFWLLLIISTIIINTKNVKEGEI